MQKRSRARQVAFAVQSPAAGEHPRAARFADAFSRLHVPLRARMLGRLLASVGSLALAVVGGGAFAKYLTRTASELTVTLEDAARTTWSQVYELVRYVEQSHPRRLEQLLDEL